MLRNVTRQAQKLVFRRCLVRFTASPAHKIQSEVYKQRHGSSSSARVEASSVDSAYVRSIASDIFALQNLLGLLTSNSDVAHNLKLFVQRLLQCHGQQHRVFVTGIGKSWAVAQRFASTLSSISISSQCIHAGEWIHGELGCLTRGDVVILVSHSGRTSELLPLPDLFRSAGCYVMAVVGDASSPLRTHCDLTVVAPADDEEKCPVPSRSIIVQEAICNAVIQHLVESMADSMKNLKKNHPGGAIGANQAH